MKIRVTPQSVNKDIDKRLLTETMVRHKLNMRSGSTDSEHLGVNENIKGNLKVDNPYFTIGPRQYFLDLEADPEFVGILTGEGYYHEGEVVTINAVADPEYTFVNWTENGVVLTTDASFEVQMHDNRTIRANFTLTPVTVNYGLLYNWFAVDDARKITSSDDWILPRYTYLDPNGDFEILANTLGGYATCANKLKEVGLTYWDAPSAGTNESAFNSRGTGVRYNPGGFGNFKIMHRMWTGNSYDAGNAYVAMVLNNSANFQICRGSGAIVWSPKAIGLSIRLIKTSTTLTNGQTGTYIGNDGKVYRTICIGNQEWLADNLIETKYRNGDTIPEVADQTTWEGLTTGALCAYNNDPATV